MDSADQELSDGSSESRPLLVHVVSPSSEVPERLTFSSLPLNTTIAEMKMKIKEAVATKPAPERQRLIYRGRALVQQDLTLAALFGSEAVSNTYSILNYIADVSQSTNTDGFTLHLVLSVPGSSSGTANTLVRDQPQIPRIHLPQPTGLPSLPGSQNVWPRRPASTSQLPSNTQVPVTSTSQPTQLFNTPQPQTSNPFLSGPIPGINANTMHGMGPHQQPFNVPTSFTYQYNPALGAPQFPMPIPAGAVPWPPGHNWPSPYPAHHSSPNLARDSTINTQQRNESSEEPSQSTTQAARQPPPSASSHEQSGSTAHNSSNVFANAQQHQPSAGQWRISINQTTFHSSNPLANASGAAPPQPAHFNNVPPFLQNSPRSQLGGLSNPTLQPHWQQVRNVANNAASTLGGRSAPSTLAYLLSSPSGPQALLLSPAGSFATSGYVRSAANFPLLGVPQLPTQMSHHQMRRQPAQHAPTQGVQPAPGQAPIVNVQLEQQPNQPQAQQQDQVGELLRILLPLGGHLWLLVRLFGFVYLFSSDRGWRNTFLLGLCALIVFFAQTRLFEPLLQYIWTPIRRHVEALVQVEEAAPDQARNQRGGRAQERHSTTAQQNISDSPVQEQVPRQRNNPLRTAFTRMERSLALFVASLIPGVGERHVAAREEAARLRREREETSRREQEERQRREEQKSQELQQDAETVQASTPQYQGKQPNEQAGNE